MESTITIRMFGFWGVNFIFIIPDPLIMKLLLGGFRAKRSLGLLGDMFWMLALMIICIFESYSTQSNLETGSAAGIRAKGKVTGGKG